MKTGSRVRLECCLSPILFNWNGEGRFRGPLFVFCLFLTRQSPVGHGLLTHEVSRSHTTTHQS